RLAGVGVPAARARVRAVLRRAGDAAGAAVRAARDRRFAAVLGRRFGVAVAETRVAGAERAGAGAARRRGVGARAGVAAARAIAVGLEGRLAAVVGVLVAVAEAGRAARLARVRRRRAGAVVRAVQRRAFVAARVAVVRILEVRFAGAVLIAVVEA